MKGLSIKERIFYGLICNENRVYQHWYTRFLLCGVDLERAKRVARRTKNWYHWCEEWVQEGNHVEKLAEEALARGFDYSARMLFLQAASCFHVGQHFFYIDSPQKDRALEQVWRAYRKALPLYGEKERPIRIDVPFRGTTIPGYLRLAPEPNRPLVIFVNGMDNLKETEQNTWTELFQRAGFNALAFDGPGQGEMLKDMPFIPDYHRAVSALIDWMEEHHSSSMDLSKIATVGFSLGGYLAPLAAAHDRRISCAVGNGGPGNLDFLPSGKKMNPVLQRGFLHITDTETYEEAKAVCQMDIKRAPAMDRPLLIFHSGGDRLIPDGRRHAQYFLDWATGEKELKFYPTGEHVCADYLDEVIPHTLDWVRERLK